MIDLSEKDEDSHKDLNLNLSNIKENKIDFIKKYILNEKEESINLLNEKDKNSIDNKNKFFLLKKNEEIVLLLSYNNVNYTLEENDFSKNKDPLHYKVLNKLITFKDSSNIIPNIIFFCSYKNINLEISKMKSNINDTYRFVNTLLNFDIFNKKYINASIINKYYEEICNYENIPLCNHLRLILKSGLKDHYHHKYFFYYINILPDKLPKNVNFIIREFFF